MFCLYTSSKLSLNVKGLSPGYLLKSFLLYIHFSFLPYIWKRNLWISSWGQKWFWQRPPSPKARKHPPVLPEWPSRYSLRFEFQLLYSKLSMNLIKNLHITQIMQGLKIGLNWTGIWVSQPDRTGHPNLPDSSCRTRLNPDFYFLNILSAKQEISVLIR